MTCKICKSADVPNSFCNWCGGKGGYNDNELLQRFFFTCGQSHIHQLSGGKVWNKDSVLQVNAANEDAAKNKVFEMFGPKWSMCYTQETISMEYYPNGVCAIISA